MLLYLIKFHPLDFNKSEKFECQTYHLIAVKKFNLNNFLKTGLALWNYYPVFSKIPHPIIEPEPEITV